MEKQNKCQICGWSGPRTHMHHIIPLKEGGRDTIKNQIELCPNCHADASADEKDFQEKHALIGQSFSDADLKEINEAALIKHELGEASFFSLLPKFQRLIEIMKKHGLDEDDLNASIMGLTKRSFQEEYR